MGRPGLGWARAARLALRGPSRWGRQARAHLAARAAACGAGRQAARAACGHSHTLAGCAIQLNSLLLRGSQPCGARSNNTRRVNAPPPCAHGRAQGPQQCVKAQWWRHRLRSRPLPWSRSPRRGRCTPARIAPGAPACWGSCRCGTGGAHAIRRVHGRCTGPAGWRARPGGRYIAFARAAPTGARCANAPRPPCTGTTQGYVESLESTAAQQRRQLGELREAKRRAEEVRARARRPFALRPLHSPAQAR